MPKQKSQKKYLYRLAVLAVLFILYLVSIPVFQALKRAQSKAHTFDFTLPLSDDIKLRYGLKDPVIIEKVVLAGTFSGWDRLRDEYKMQKVNSNKWEYSISLPEGIHRYRFVVYIQNIDHHDWPEASDKGVIWLHDKNAWRNAANSRGGLTSVYKVQNYAAIQKVFHLALLWIGLALLTYTILEFIIKSMMKSRLSLRVKITLVVVFFVILSNAYFIYRGVINDRSMMEKLNTDMVNMVHVYLLGQGVDFNDLSSIKKTDRISGLLVDFFRYSHYRLNYQQFSNDEHVFQGIELHDPAGKIIAMGFDPITTTNVSYLGFTNDTQMQETFQKRADEFHQKIQEWNTREKAYFFHENFVETALPVFKRSKKELRILKRSVFFYPQNVIYYPIIIDDHLIAYYLAYIMPQAQSDLIKDALLMNLLLLALFTLLYTVLVSQVGKNLLLPLEQLLSGIQDIKKGNLDHALSVHTKDEIEDLSNEFNVMIQELKSSRQKVQEYTDTLEDKVESRTLELKEKNMQLNTMLDELKVMQEQVIVKEKMASLGELTAGIAHEIKNPLNFVNNFSDLSSDLLVELKELVHKKQLSVEQEEEVSDIIHTLKSNIEMISKHGNRANQILDSMLLHSREHDDHRVATNMAELLKEAANLSFHSWRARGQDFQCEFIYMLDESLPEIQTYKQQLSRAFLNIINNSCYAVHDKDRHKKTKDFSPTIVIKASASDESMEIVIQDNGTGINASELSKIFQPFYTSKPTGLGTGLGLSISYDIIVNKHQGELSCESEAGKGCTMKIVLPLK